MPCRRAPSFIFRAINRGATKSMVSDLLNWTPCRPPERKAMVGRFVSLRPYEPAGKDGEALWAAFGGPATNDLIRFFPNAPFADAGAFAAWLDHWNGQGDWITYVFADKASSACVGMASYMRIDPDNGSIEVGSVAHGPAMARSAMATEAHYLMARHVFDELGYRRYEWKCDSENAASRRAADRLGFTHEGRFRQHMVNRGKNRDTDWYSMLDGEWPELKRAFEAWLEPGNFDRHGHQRHRLEDLRDMLA